MRLLTTKGVLDEIERHARLSLPVESGGLLLGYWPDNRTAIVTDVSGPGPDAVQGKTFYVPDYTFDVAWCTKQQRDSGFKKNYLGDWHSHPFTSRAYLSRRDGQALAKIFDTTVLNQRPGISIVAALDDQRFSVKSWFGIGIQLPFGLKIPCAIPAEIMRCD